MFTGIIEAVGTITHRISAEDGGKDLRLRVSAPPPISDLVEGESIAVDGACLTVLRCGEGWFEVQAVSTTRERTFLGDLTVGSRVNLERGLSLGERLGGHLVQGHVDGVGTVREVAGAGDAVLVDIEVPGDVAEVSVPRGSITVNGVSLTVNSIPHPGVIQVSLIPYTMEHTTLGDVAPGDRVHLEGDMIGKFVRQLVRSRT